MTKHIAIEDDVYEMLKREKGERTFSEVIRDNLESNRQLLDVEGAGVLDADTMEAVKTDVGGMSERTVDNDDADTL